MAPTVAENCLSEITGKLMCECLKYGEQTAGSGGRGKGSRFPQMPQSSDAGLQRFLSETVIMEERGRLPFAQPFSVYTHRLVAHAPVLFRAGVRTCG